MDYQDEDDGFWWQEFEHVRRETERLNLSSNRKLRRKKPRMYLRYCHRLCRLRFRWGSLTTKKELGATSLKVASVPFCRYVTWEHVP